MSSTTFAQRTGRQPARARVAVPAVVALRADARQIPASPTMPSMYGHVWQAQGIVRFDATNGALGTSTKCPSRLLGPRTT